MNALTSISGAIDVQGYVFVREFEPEMGSFDAISQFGQIETVEGLNPLQTLIPRHRAEAPPNTYSGNFGTDEFPLHTDLAHWAIPPRYLVLRCQQGSDSVATRVIDGRELVMHEGITTLERILVQPRRPMRNGKHLLQLLQRIDPSDGWRLRWDSIYLRPATIISEGLFAHVLLFLSRSVTTDLILRHRGDTLIIDNWRCLHGRTKTPENARTRFINRAYLRTIG